MTPPRSSRLRLLVAATAAVALMMPAAPSGGSTTTNRTHPAPSSAAAGTPSEQVGATPGPQLERPSTVTLLTGDRVVLTPNEGAQPRVGFRARPGSNGDFSVHRSDHGIYVTPHDVVGLVPRVLDPELFNITALVEMGYDDAHATALPLIVEHAGAATLRRDTAAQLAVTDDLPSIDAAAATLPKAAAASLGDALTDLDGASRRTVAHSLGGATRIWLDRVVEASSEPASTATTSPTATVADQPWDHYLSQVDAPAAWGQGLSGAGVTVAVLDSGVDDQHPALSGQVVAEQNFSDSPTADDVAGHGTHVASLLAGSGAGSEGARQGIAPGVTLLSGKVLGDENQGQISWIIAGMEWATAQGSDVVNLSLGGRAVSATDPLVESLERLSASTDTLFVVAAGNRGWISTDPFSIDTPGIARSALTVAAVRANDVQATFSSEGPTVESRALKPDVSAPGVDLLGANAGARAGDPDLYRPDSGTSMATPVVAGAVALLAEQHPGWSADRLKAAVMSSAHRADSFDMEDPWRTGAGRLDLAAATGDLHATTPAVDVGYLTHPNDAAQTRPVHLSNDGDHAVTLTATDSFVDVDGNPASADAVAVEPAVVTIPAHDQAVVDVTVDPATIADTMWRGLVTFSDGAEERLRVPVGVYDEPESYDLDIRVLDRNGDPWDTDAEAGHPHADPSLQLFDRASGRMERIHPDEKGEATVRVRPGVFSLFGRVFTPGATEDQTTMTIVGTTDLTVDEDTRLVLDARQARPLTAPVVAGHDVSVDGAVLLYRSGTDGEFPTGYTEGLVIAPEDVAAGRVFHTPVASVSTGTFEASARWLLRAEPQHGPGSAKVLDLLASTRDFGAELSPRLDHRAQRDLARVDHVVHPVGRFGAHVMGSVAWTTVSNVETVVRQEVRPPYTDRVLTNVDPDQRRATCVSVEANNWSSACGSVPTLREGETADVEIGGDLHITPTTAFRGPEDLFVAGGLSDGRHLGPLGITTPAGTMVLLTANGEELGRSRGSVGGFEVPNRPLRVRLDYEQPMTGTPLHVAARTRTVWDFVTAPPTDISQQGTLPLPLLDVDHNPELTPDGAAPRHGPLVLAPRFDSPTGHTRVSDVRLWWSADGGKHWRAAPVRRQGEADFSARLTGNEWRRGTDLSLRVVGRDQAGNRVDQTVIGLIPTP